MNKVLLIDVSNLFFRSFYAVPKTFYDKNGKLSNAIYGVVSIVFSTIEKEKPDYIFAAKDLRGENFRHKKLKSYKAGRPKMPDELISQIDNIFKFFELAKIPLLSKEMYEADDIIATLVEKLNKDEIFILSADQDLFQLINDRVTCIFPKSGKNHKIKKNEVLEKFGIPPENIVDYKALAGDSSDNLKGVAGIGPKSAVKILKEYGELENAIKNIENIEGKVKTLLSSGIKDALLTKELAQLKKDLTIDNFSKESGLVKKGVSQELSEFLNYISSGRLLNMAKRVLNKDDQDSLF